MTATPSLKHRLAIGLQRSVVRGLLALPTPALRRLVGKERVVDGNTLDLQAQLLMKLAKVAGKRPHEQSSLSAARRMLDASAA
ncbi:MAG: hypothetical protein ABI175_26005, partial [Polyangiales bacterium]